MTVILRHDATARAVHQKNDPDRHAIGFEFSSAGPAVRLAGLGMCGALRHVELQMISRIRACKQAAD